MTVAFAEVTVTGRALRIEFEWVGDAGPLMIFLHEGLGSLAMWKEFPATLCRALGCRGLVYSRPGYGRSTPRVAGEMWGPDFMHRQAHEVLPALLRALGVNIQLDRPWLFGHSDGGSIALLYAARYPDHVAGLVVAAPHLMVEQISIDSIAEARQAYLDTDLRNRLARYHDDPDSAFWGWNDVWLSAAFRPWNITSELNAITCALLAVQGVDDEYGTLEQIRGIKRQVPQAELLELPECGHSPHRDQSESVIAASATFFRRQQPRVQ